MMKISIFVPESAVLQGIADPRYLFTAANQFLGAAGKEPLFNVQLVGRTKEVKQNGGAFSIHVDQLLEDVTQSDLVIIPPLFGDMGAAIEANRSAIPWIIKQYKQGAEIASLCVGAFMLASTGLLNGKKCSTHWAFYNEFKERFPEVEIIDGTIITEENRIYSSGGANSYWNLMLYLLEKYTDREIAILAAKYFAIDIDRNSQSSYTVFNGQKHHTDQDIIKAQTFIENNYQDKITVDQLADMLAISRRSFERRFKQATNNTVLEYLQRVKMENAKRDFESTRQNINEVMFNVGYNDSKAFRSVFKRITGLTPIAYRKKYNKDNTSGILNIEY
ncbi:MAG: helix-turn-helix domain-containing protein [Calditrichaeota bacterium]|nr:helix-turn-helix domain-containing protein [Calditrichota bacterium]